MPEPTKIDHADMVYHLTAVVFKNRHHYYCKFHGTRIRTCEVAHFAEDLVNYYLSEASHPSESHVRQFLMR